MADRTFDFEAIYDEQIAPLMAQILDICDRHGLPMVADFEYAAEYFATSAIVPTHASPRMKALVELIRPAQERTVGKGGTPAPRPWPAGGGE